MQYFYVLKTDFVLCHCVHTNNIGVNYYITTYYYLLHYYILLKMILLQANVPNSDVPRKRAKV